MSLAIVYSRGLLGIQSPLVTVEIHLSNGVPAFSIVGLPETGVKESKDRVRSAILNSGFEFAPRRTTVNLGPADLPKEGSRYDLPIAIGILAASGQISSTHLKNYEFAGELALSGALCPIQGALSFALQTQKTGRTLILPKANADEAMLCGEVAILPATHLTEIFAHLTGKQLLSPHILSPAALQETSPTSPDLSDVCGQPHARRALEIAAAGGHNLLLTGPPGTGKTMLASRLPSILPLLDYEEALEVAAITSISSKGFNAQQWRQRPFRAPHHTASTVAVAGGGKPPRPGEISLAHQGVLFLDELPEFHRHVLEALREPLESGTIVISRAGRQAEFPARFQLVAAMNPCPCGFAGDPNGRCQCTREKIQRYRTRLSGPLLDRIDLHIDVPALPKGLLTASTTYHNESSETVRKRVIAAREKQKHRQSRLNFLLTNKQLEKVARLDKEHSVFLEQAIHRLQLSARAYHRILRVARTIADLAHSEVIEKSHLTEALSYRRITRAI